VPTLPRALSAVRPPSRGSVAGKSLCLAWLRRAAAPGCPWQSPLLRNARREQSVSPRAGAGGAELREPAEGVDATYGYYRCANCV
jgi:hypothetical protein